MDKILGLGNALTDVAVALKEENILQEMALPKGGMTHIDAPTYDRLRGWLANQSHTVTPGGSVANACRAMARMGMLTGYLGKVGADDVGRRYAQSLTSVGVENRLIVTEELPSGVCCALISEGGERTFADHMGASIDLHAEEMTAERMGGYDYLFLEGYLVQNHALIERAAALAKELGMTVVMDMASYNVILADLDFSRYLVEHYVDVVFANEEEAQALTDLEPMEALHALAALTETAVVKVGAKGSLVQHGQQVWQVPAVEVAQVVDTTSAGDHYAAGFLYGMLRGAALDRCAVLGARLAALAIQVMGTVIPENAFLESKLKN